MNMEKVLLQEAAQEEELRAATAAEEHYRCLQHLLYTSISYRLLAFSFILVLTFSALRHPPTPPPPLPAASTTTPWLPFFHLFNGLAFIVSASGLIVSASHLLSSPSPSPNKSLPRLLASSLSNSALGFLLLLLTILFLSAAFPFAGLTSIGPAPSLQYAVILPCAFGGFVLLVGTVLVLKEFFVPWWASFMEDPVLRRAMKRESVFGYLVTMYVQSTIGDDRFSARLAEGVSLMLNSNAQKQPSMI